MLCSVDHHKCSWLEFIIFMHQKRMKDWHFQIQNTISVPFSPVSFSWQVHYYQLYKFFMLSPRDEILIIEMDKQKYLDYIVHSHCKKMSGHCWPLNLTCKSTKAHFYIRVLVKRLPNFGETTPKSWGRCAYLFFTTQGLVVDVKSLRRSFWSWFSNCAVHFGSRQDNWQK
jgi:hypothetical protein